MKHFGCFFIIKTTVWSEGMEWGLSAKANVYDYDCRLWGTLVVFEYQNKCLNEASDPRPLGRGHLCVLDS